ncbi:MAG TPA: tetratricopeptide repeat protein, partial [Flavipsychrobacter sp.]|nr:tetratricopeptide repeat protein [Flavipsychrobacter sp.]
DSVAEVRKERLDSMKMARQAVFDSMRMARERVADSVTAVRKHAMDSVKTIQKHRADSLAVIRKYRESKRYKDSVAVMRQIRLDSMTAVRKAKSDSMISARKKTLDSATAVRKKYSDSVSSVRKKYTDSIGAVRKVRADSLAKVKENRERLKKSQEKKNEDKFKLALELKIKKKREAWSNEKMLKKGWSVPRRVLQNTYTHYNYYFNAERKMDEALENMQRMGRENYDSLLALFPFDPDKDSTKLAADMDSIIRKASVGIQIHDPRTKWADDLYLLLGQAYYYKGNYGEASTAFRYIIAMNQLRKQEEQKKAAAKKKPVDKDVSVLQKEKNGALDFLKHRTVNNEAVLWLARTYTEAQKENDAESILDLIETDKNLNDNLKARIALEKAYLHLSRREYKAASQNLTIVANAAEMPNWIQTRAAYLNGQLLYEEGNYAAAAQHFEQVIDQNPKIEMDFYARKNLAYSLIQQGGSQEEATASLRRMLKDGKYVQYNEQIYYVLGRLSANSDHPEEAIDYLKQSIASSKSTRKQKALSFAGLGNVYYLKGEYKLAKVAYDSASSYGKSIANDEEITAVKRSSVLDKVVTPVETIYAQDSLLALASLPEKEQRNVIRRYIRMLEKQKEDSAFRAANSEGTPKVAEDADPGGGSMAGNWYFTNATQMQQGLNDFKRKWGSRQNVDNWRRMGGGGGAMAGSGGGSDGGTTTATEETDENGLPTEASLLAAIPNTTEEQNSARKRIQDAYIELANAYVKDLEDHPKGTQTLDTMDKRFPNNDHKAEALYLRYQIALKQDKLSEAQALSEQLRKEHSDTKWAKELAPSEDTRGLLASTVSVANYYDETYGMMMQRQYTDVLQRVRNGQKQYSDPVYTKRFRIMEAIALAGVGNYDQADTLLTDFISTKPSDSLRSWADAVLNYVKKTKPVVPPPGDSTQNSVSGSQTTIPPTVSPANPATATSSTNPPVSPTDNKATAYTYNASGEHFFIFYFTKMESKTMGIKAGLTDFNTFNFSSQKLSVTVDMLKPDQGIILVKSFPAASHAKIYLNSVRSNKSLFKEYKSDEYQLLMISTENMKKLNTDRDMNEYLKFYKGNYK